MTAATRLRGGNAPPARGGASLAARTARHGRDRLTLHMPEGWHRERERPNLFEAACGPPTAAA